MLDLLGCLLADAESRLASKGIDYTVCETFPNSKTPVIGPLRIIRQTKKNGTLHLTVCKIPDRVPKAE